jgi:DNA end-binding protein Ku
MGEPGERRAGEMPLARQLIDQLTAKGFQPAQYRDHYRDRLREVVERKVAGDETTITAPVEPRAQVIDLMDALKQSLARERAPVAAAPASTASVPRKATPRRAAAKKSQ